MKSFTGNVAEMRAAHGSRYFSQFNSDAQRWSLTKTPIDGQVGHRTLEAAVLDTARRNISHEDATQRKETHA
jgi:hypothetical protein